LVPTAISAPGLLRHRPLEELQLELTDGGAHASPAR
jgi:hypothetical protein